jgi:hypothetical protein
MREIGRFTIIALAWRSFGRDHYSIVRWHVVGAGESCRVRFDGSWLLEIRALSLGRRAISDDKLAGGGVPGRGRPELRVSRST